MLTRPRDRPGRGYAEENIVILTDDRAPGTHMPTKRNMLNAMRWLVKDAHSNDSLFFHCTSPRLVVDDLH